MKYLIFICSFFLVGCDNPAKELSSNTPSYYELTFSQGGLKVIENLSYDESNDLLSKKSERHYKVNKNSNRYSTVQKFLSSNTDAVSFFNQVEIPSRHVLLLYIEYQDHTGNIQRVFLGENWFGYYTPVDSFGESGTIIYPVNNNEIIKFLSEIK